MLLTHSCTGALEMAALLAGVGPGDEVVMPSFTFPSTANAFVLRGATPVFAEIREDTLNLDPDRFEAAIGPRTRADRPGPLQRRRLRHGPDHRDRRRRRAMVIEDAAQGILATYRGRALGSIGSLGTFSFHETKTLSSGEGGALLVNDPDLIDRAEILLEKGTDRVRFFRGEIDKYTWVDVGSSFLMSEITAAFLYAQLEVADEIVGRRLDSWDRYHAGLADLEARRPAAPARRRRRLHAQRPGLLAPAALGAIRDDLIATLGDAGILAIFHYVPLHESKAGRRWGRPGGSLRRTEELAARMVRLPLWAGMEDQTIDRVIEAVEAALER